MKQVTFTSGNEIKSIYEIEHNLDSDNVLVNVKVLRDNGWWDFPVAVHHINNNLLIIDVIKPMPIKAIMLVLD